MILYITIYNILILYIVMLYHKTLCVWAKNLWDQREGSTNRILERTK